MEEKSVVNTSDKFAILDLKLKLLNVVCATLINEPHYYSTSDRAKAVISNLVKQLSVDENGAEFVFKLALYVRDDLNIRSTANFLVALGANTKNCQKFLNKYFSAIIRLPSDMLDVVTMFLYLPDVYLEKSALPACVRKSIQKKFPEFDVYQLAKYNKERSQKKKVKKQKEVKGRSLSPGLGGELTRQNTQPPKITLKQLIRKVHLGQPAEQVMSILGKKYPVSAQSFEQSGLRGEWQTSRAGQRMKLPVPETWETLVSAKGNKHSTWETLLDHKKLPFMAMLRNLRNMLITGISPDHHELVLNRLTDEKSVISSRQLPWRFLSAYQAINIDLEAMMNDILDNDGSNEKVIQVRVKGRKGRAMQQMRTIKKRVIIPVHMPDLPLIERYRSSLDTAIRIATTHNLPAITGKTLIFCDVSGSMKSPCSTRGNMGTSIQTVKDVAILLGLMLQHCCDESDFRIFSSPGPTTRDRCDLEIPLEPNTILNNVKRILDASELLGGGTDFPYDAIELLIKKNQKVDTIVILSDMMIAPGFQPMAARGHTVTSILKQYRDQVNPDLLFVAVDLYGNGKSIVDVNTENPKEILITGFSDNILRFIAERGNRAQLDYVEKIDQLKLKKLSSKKTPQNQTQNSQKQEQLEGFEAEIEI